MVATRTATTSREELRRDQIRRAFRSTVEELGIEGATLRETARRAGVTKGMLAYYYESKRDLVVDTILAAASRLAQRIDALAGSVPTAQRLDAMFELELPVQSKFWMEVWAETARDPSLGRGYSLSLRESMARCLQAGIDRGEFRSDLGAERIAIMFNALIIGMKVLSTLEPVAVSREIALDLLRFVVTLLRATPARS